VKHQNRFSSGFVANRAASASTGEGSCCAHVLFASLMVLHLFEVFWARLAPVSSRVRVTSVARFKGTRITEADRTSNPTVQITTFDPARKKPELTTVHPGGDSLDVRSKIFCLSKIRNFLSLSQSMSHPLCDSGRLPES
jgi:hypothetical protein